MCTSKILTTNQLINQPAMKFFLSFCFRFHSINISAAAMITANWLEYCYGITPSVAVNGAATAAAASVIFLPMARARLMASC